MDSTMPAGAPLPTPPSGMRSLSARVLDFPELEATIEHRLAAADGPVRLVVDLAAVPYCDSCGMRVLLGACQRVTAAGGEFRLRGVHGQPQRALRLTGLDRVLRDAGTTGEVDARSHG